MTDDSQQLDILRILKEFPKENFNSLDLYTEARKASEEITEKSSIIKLRFKTPEKQLIAMLACLIKKKSPFFGSYNIQDSVWNDSGFSDEPNSKSSNEISSFLNSDNKPPYVFLETSGSEETKIAIHRLENFFTQVENVENNGEILVLLSHYHAAWVDSVLTYIFHKKSFSFSLERRSLPRRKVIRSTPSYLLLKALQSEILLDNIHTVILGSEALDEEKTKSLKRFNPKLKIMQIFGTTETLALKTENKDGREWEIFFSEEEVEIKKKDKDQYQLMIKKDKMAQALFKNKKVEKFPRRFITNDILEKGKLGGWMFKRKHPTVVNYYGEKFSKVKMETLLMEKFPKVCIRVTCGQTSMLVEGFEVVVESDEKLYQEIQAYIDAEKLPVIKMKRKCL